MDGSVSLINNLESYLNSEIMLYSYELVGSSDEDGNGLGSLGDASDLEDLGVVTEGDFLNHVGVSELFWGELIDVSDGDASDSLIFG